MEGLKGKAADHQDPPLTCWQTSDTDQGQPRVVGAGLYLLQGQPLGIYYLACDSNCDNSGNWERVRLFDRGSGVNDRR